MIIKKYTCWAHIGNFYLKSGLYRLHLLQILILDDFCKIHRKLPRRLFLFITSKLCKDLIFNEVTKYNFLCLKLQKKNEKDHSQETNHVLIQKTWSRAIFFLPRHNSIRWPSVSYISEYFVSTKLIIPWNVPPSYERCHSQIYRSTTTFWFLRRRNKFFTL